MYEVARIPGDKEARAFVERHHYSGSYPAARARFGLHRGSELVGVAVLSQPASQAALDKALPYPGANRAELGRFVLLDDVPANGESWFLARAFELARADGFDAVVAHSDPEPRTVQGRTLFAGHVGTIYQATNAVYRGKTNAASLRILLDGTILSPRALSKVRAKDKGWKYVVENLVARGAPEPSGDWDEWVTLAVRHVSRRFRHPGNHRYVWALDRALRKLLPRPMPYPKGLRMVVPERP